MDARTSVKNAFASLLGLFGLVLPALAAPLEARLSSVKTVYQFPTSQPNAWAENLAVRSNGKILVTRFDVPELWLVDPVTHLGQLVYSFPNSNTLTGVAQIGDDVFAVAAGTVNHTTTVAELGSWSVWKVDATTLEETQSASIDLITTIPEAVFLNGVKSFVPTKAKTGCQKALVIADSTLGGVWLVDPASGSYSLGWKDASLEPRADSTIPIGINGIALEGNDLYYTLWTGGVLNKVAVKVPSASSLAAGKARLQLQSPIRTLANTEGFFDDFAVAKNGVVYASTNVLNTVLKVSPSGKGVETVAGNIQSLDVAGATAVIFSDATQRKLYVSTGGAHAAPVNGTITEPGKVVSIVL